MTTQEIAVILAALERADKKAHEAITAALYEITHIVKNPKPPISDEAFDIMWTEALGRMPDGMAGRIQAMHFLKAVETYYGIIPQTQRT
jgi:hypothetical protein